MWRPVEWKRCLNSISPPHFLKLLFEQVYVCERDRDIETESVCVCIMCACVLQVSLTPSALTVCWLHLDRTIHLQGKSHNKNISYDKTFQVAKKDNDRCSMPV